ncbi:hypothetical protein OF820_08605 [Oceanotoga sp. DSM 15011]|uniref:hypothetical protein n=1 Tax=Oceanotoga sp. DSM 15011 TaxID=2984951 RepID=UPI0021F48FBB|nr:hypothetical protein [Oceanotoga sp. DSM 15011]UYO99135.1 hypothetical protein OF820_08605 [Oceanotoga sp. DSM 15011]
MKKILYILLTLSILILLSSCILNEKELKKYEDDTKFSKLNTNSRNELVKLIYAAYNQGAGYSYQELKEKESQMHNTKQVLAYYQYFMNEITLDETISKAFGERLSPTDFRLRNYVGNIIKNADDGSSTNWLIDYVDQEVPVKPQSTDRTFEELNPKKITNFDKKEMLTEKVEQIIKYTSDKGRFWDVWLKFYGQDYTESGKTYPKITPNESLTNQQIKEYAQYIVEMAYTYTHSDIMLNQSISESELWKKEIYFDHIPVELLLAVLTQESYLLPLTYRAEISGGKIYAVSFGLAHTLVDADNIVISKDHYDIGNGKSDQRNFETISKLYINKSGTEYEKYFSDWDLTMVRGSMIYSLTYLDIIYQKLIVEYE